MEGGKGGYGFGSGNAGGNQPTERASRRGGWGGGEEEVVGQFGRMTLLDGMPTQKKQGQYQEEQHGYRTPEKHRQDPYPYDHDSLHSSSQSNPNTQP